MAVMKRIIVMAMMCLGHITFSQDSIVFFFPFNADQLSKQQVSILKNKMLKEVAHVTSIKGTTDSIGNLFYNQDLLQRRAQSVFHLLDSLVPTMVSNCQVIGLGELPIQGRTGRKVVVYFEEKLSVKLKASKVGDLVKINNLNFQPGSESLVGNSSQTLNDLLGVLTDIPTLKIAIEGHICCEINDDNQLSLARAKVVYDYLIKNGISAKRLSYQGFGASKPLHPLPEVNERERSENRRVEIRIVKK